MLITEHASKYSYNRSKSSDIRIFFYYGDEFMLREITATRQNSTDTQKRWFTDSDMDLFVWHINGEPVRFQLGYNKQANEHAINWNSTTGFSHNSVDSGDEITPSKYKMSPILLPDGEFDALAIAAEFLQASKNIDETISDFIYARLLEYPGHYATPPNAAPAPEDL